jgi:hypothetical protein
VNRTNTRIQAAVAVFGLALLPGVIYGQAKADEPIKVLTICEVFSDPNRYDGQQIAVLGRFDRGV